MKKVSFKVAQYIKSIGFPQGFQLGNAFYDTQGNISYYTELADLGTHQCDAPTYVEVWLWLAREKNILLRIAMTTDEDIEICWNCFCKNPYIFLERPDPEETIIATIEYLVENDLIK